MKRIDQKAVILMLFCFVNINILFAQQSHDDGKYFSGMHMMDWKGTAKLSTVSGKVIIDSTGTIKVNNISMPHKIYYLDTLNNGAKNIILYFGPYWYKPQNGIKKPTNGQSVTLTGIKSTTMTPSMFAVYTINGQQWRPSVGTPPWMGGLMTRSSTDSTRIYCLTDSLTSFKMPANSMGIGMMGNGMMWSDSLFVEMFEMMSDSVVNMTPGKAAMGFHLEGFNMSGSSMMKSGSNDHGMMSLLKNMKMTFHINSDSLNHHGMTMDKILLKYLDIDNQWKTVPNQTLNQINGYVSFTSANLYSSYAVVSNSAVGIEKYNELPYGFELKQNYPNPFNPTTNISYNLPISGEVVIKIFDVTGREMQTLESGFKQAGQHIINFNASNLPSGVYFYQIKTGSFSATKKLLLLK